MVCEMCSYASHLSTCPFQPYFNHVAQVVHISLLLLLEFVMTISLSCVSSVIPIKIYHYSKFNTVETEQCENNMTIDCS